MSRIGHLDNRCPEFEATQALKVLGGRWKTPILTLLSTRPMRFSELKKSLGGITHKMLSEQLQALTREGLLTRTELVTSPPKIVEYGLSEQGEGMKPVLIALSAWGRQQTLQHDRNESGGQP